MAKSKKDSKAIKIRKTEIPTVSQLCHICYMFTVFGEETICEWCAKGKKSSEYKSVKMEEEYVSEESSIDEGDENIWEL